MTENEIRKCIEENLQDNVFVEAGAGAGKTSLIVKRIVNQLKSGITPDAIVVITFTNAAAEELRSRITLCVREACKEPSYSEPERANLCNAVKYLDRMNISTIHSFGFKLLQERVFDAKLPMDIVLMEENETKHKHKEFFREWAKQLTKEDWKKLCRFETNKYAVKEKILRFFESICELSDDMVIQEGESAECGPMEDDAKTLVDDFIARMCDKINTLTKNSYTINQLPDENLMSQGKKIRDLYLKTPVDSFAVLREICAPFEGKTTQYIKVKKALDPNGYVNIFDEELRKWDEDVQRNAKIEELFKLQLDAKYSLWLNYAVKARSAYRQGRPNRTVSNDDLLQKTQRLISESKQAREYFARKIRCIYVDEFQDTDHIQEDFIWKLAVNPECETELRDGVLFLVGDPKQSIYRFRGAEPEVYFSAKEKMDKLPNAKVYCLQYNYRSNGKLIEWINREFAQRPQICPSGYSPMAAQKTLPAATPSNFLAGVYYHKNPNCNASGLAVDKAVVEDIRCLCKFIRNTVDYKYQICEYDANNNPKARNIRYSDFLVLCYSKTDMEKYLEEMHKCGIPVQINGALHLEENKALNAFVRLFDYLTHPYDKLKKAGAIEYLQNNGFRDEAVAHRLSNEVKGMSDAGIAAYLLQNYHLLLPVGSHISSAELLSVQTKLHQMVETVLGAQRRGNEGMAEQFRQYCKAVVERELPLQENEDAVRFMNLHKAKGLEGNIVVIAKRTENKAFRESSFCDQTEYYPVCSDDYGKVEWSSYRNKQNVLQRAQGADAAEKIRLEYVAATRAKQVFVVMDAINESAMFTDYKFCDSAPLVDSIENIINLTYPLTNLQEAAAQTVNEWGTKRIPQEPVYYDYSPSDFEKKVGQKKKPDDNAESAGAESTGEAVMAEADTKSRRPRGAVFGTAMHRSLELLIERVLRPAAAASEENRDRFVRSCAKQALLEGKEEIPTEEVSVYEEYLLKIMECFAAWEQETKVLQCAKEVYTELPFSFYDEEMLVEGEEKPVWMNGTADLIVRDAEGNYTVLDYKSDRSSNYTEEEFEEVLKKKYTGQLLMYRKAVSRLFGVDETSIKLKLLSFRGEEDITLRCTELQ